MADKVLKYEGEDVIVAYNVRRCIHMAECVHGLPAVFDPERRPWVRPDEAAADPLTEVVTRCPTGALQFTRKDGGPEEAVPDQNTVTVDPDGPLFVRGDIEIVMPDGSVLLRETRVALCRCGASNNKPFCDNSHGNIDFQDSGVFREVRVKSEKEGEDGLLRVRPSRNGPLLVQGPLDLIGAEERVRGSQAALCRCGASSNKPFCDGTHNTIGFTSE
ncbi:MAG: CDGSH iron-sulfur domain-containing protein [Rhodothermales bacterium]